jgi:hypothetical protein
MRALTTTELEHCAGGIETVIVTASRIYGSSSSSDGYRDDSGTNGYDASNWGTSAEWGGTPPYDPHSGFGPKGDMGFFEYAGSCIDDPATCIGAGADEAVGLFKDVIDRLSTELGTALNIALYSRIGSQMDELNTQFTGTTDGELADFFERAIANGELRPAP